jgi:hypothetical protein
MRRSYEREGYNSKPYVKAQEAISNELMGIRFTAKVVEKLCDTLRAQVDEVRQIERQILDVAVNKCRMPRTHFIKVFPGNETNLKWIDGEVSGFALVRSLGLAIPGADKRQTGELHVVLLEGVLELDGIAEIAEPVFAAAESAFGDLEHHGLDACEAGLGGHFDHVIEFVIIALARALHEPGIDFGTELDFAHVVDVRWWFGV